MEFIVDTYASIQFILSFACIVANSLFYQLNKSDMFGRSLIRLLFTPVIVVMYTDFAKLPATTIEKFIFPCRLCHGVLMVEAPDFDRSLVKILLTDVKFLTDLTVLNQFSRNYDN